MLPSHWNGHAASGDAGDTGADGSDGSPDPDGDGGGGDAGACDPAAPVCDPGCDAGSFCNDLCACEPNTLDVYDADREFRVASSTACSDIALGLRVTWEGRVPMSTLLPESVLLATGDMFDVPRYEAANAYVGAVLRAVHYTRFDDALAAGDFELMSDDERLALVAAIFLADTRVPLSSIATELAAFCPDLALGSEKADIPETTTSRYGFFCPAPGIPDCAPPEPTPPEDCPPELLDCPDCPYLEIAEGELEILEDAYDAFDSRRDTEGLLDLLGIYVEALLQTAATGSIPNPASIAVSVATVYLGEDYPGLTFIIETLSATAQGTLLGGPLLGTAMGVWAALSSWGDLSEQDSWNSRLAAARRRVNEMRRYCREIRWAQRQAECRVREAERFDSRTADCVEMTHLYDARVAQWEADNDTCEADQAAARQARADAWTITNYLRSKGFGFTREAFEVCCDGPYPFEDTCPPRGTIEREPIPIWGFGPREGYLGSFSLIIGTGSTRAFGPDAGGELAVEWVFGFPGEAPVPFGDVDLDIEISNPRLEGPGLRGVFEAGPRPPDFETPIPFDIEFDSETGPLPDDEYFSFNLIVDITVDAETVESRIPDAVILRNNVAEFHPHVVTAGGVFDVTGGGDFTDREPFAWGPSLHALVSTPDGQLLVSTDAAVYDITETGGDLTDVTPYATFAPGGLISGLAIDHFGSLLVTDLLGGLVHRVVGGGDYTRRTPFAFGLSYPTETIAYDSRLLIAENGRHRIVDASVGGDLSGAPAWIDLEPYGPQHFSVHPWRSLFISAAAPPDGDGAIFDVTASERAESAYFTGMFNPSGFALRPDGRQWLVSEFAEDGSLLDLAEAESGADLDAAERFATGLEFPNGIAYRYVRDPAFDAE